MIAQSADFKVCLIQPIRINLYVTVCYLANAVVLCDIFVSCVFDLIAAGLRQAHVCLAFLCPLRYCVFAADLMTFHQVGCCYAFYLMERSVICEFFLLSGYFNRAFRDLVCLGYHSTVVPFSSNRHSNGLHVYKVLCVVAYCIVGSFL